MRVIDIENIVTNMKDDTRFVLRCEEVFHDKISSAAASILMNKGQKPIVCLTGPSGSGKTTTAMRLREYLENLGVKVCMLSMDNFFLPLDQRPPEASDWESPYCVNRDLLIEDIHRLMDGELVELPVYDFKAGGVGGYKPMQGDKDAVIIAEGIHMLNPLIFDQLRSEATGVYVAPRTRIITHKDRIVRPEQLRVARRMIRDYQGRGHSLRQTVERAESVDRAQLHHAEQAEREHPHRHVPRLRAVHPRAVFEGDPRVLQPARRSVYRRARTERPDGRCQLRAVAAHGLCPARLHRARVRRRQLL